MMAMPELAVIRYDLQSFIDSIGVERPRSFGDFAETHVRRRGAVACLFGGRRGVSLTKGGAGHRPLLLSRPQPQVASHEYYAVLELHENLLMWLSPPSMSVWIHRALDALIQVRVRLLARQLNGARARGLIVACSRGARVGDWR